MSTSLRNSESGMVDQVMVSTNAEGQRFVKLRVRGPPRLPRPLFLRLLWLRGCYAQWGTQTTRTSHGSGVAGKVVRPQGAVESLLCSTDALHARSTSMGQAHVLLLQHLVALLLALC